MGFFSSLFGIGGEGVGAALGGVGSLAKDLRSAITGDIDPEKKAEIETKLAEIEGKIAEAQNEVNKAEAQNGSLFVAGWRPFIGWVGGIGLAYHFIGYPFLTWLTAIWFPTVIPPVLSAEGLISIILGMLGLGGLRSWEKYTGVNEKH